MVFELGNDQNNQRKIPRNCTYFGTISTEMGRTKFQCPQSQDRQEARAVELVQIRSVAEELSEEPGSHLEGTVRQGCEAEARRTRGKWHQFSYPFLSTIYDIWE